jgi:hypothetical protein
MMRKSLNLNLLNQTLVILVRANGLRNNAKAYSTTTKCFREFHILLGDSIFVTALTIGLVFGMIQRKNLDKCTRLCTFYDESILLSTPLTRKLPQTVPRV